MVSFMWFSAVVMAGSINLSQSSSIKNATEIEMKGTNLAESIKEALRNVTTEGPTFQDETISTSTEKSTPINVPVQIQLQGENLFSGLAQNVGQLNIGGIIMEAFKLAQNSIALFGQSLATQLVVGEGGTPVIIISNSTKLVGV